MGVRRRWHAQDVRQPDEEALRVRPRIGLSLLPVEMNAAGVVREADIQGVSYADDPMKAEAARNGKKRW